MRLIAISGMTGVSDEALAEYGQIISAAYPDARVDILSKNVLPEDEIIKALQGYEILMSGFQTMTERAYAETKLRAFCTCSIGFDFTNWQAASKYDVLVTNNPEYCIDEVAEHAVGLMLALNRQLYKMVPLVQGGHWGFSVLRPLARFKGSTVGLYGFGRIPRMLAKKLQSLEVEILTCDPYITPEQAKEGGARLVDFDELLAKSDFISIHAPLMESTKGIFNADVFKKMKKSAYLLNTARGPLINQEDLYQALTEGWIRGAALDVLEKEPPQEVEKKLIALPNVLVTGHAAFYSDDALALQTKLTAENILRVLRGEMPRNIVNREVLDRIDWIKK